MSQPYPDEATWWSNFENEEQLAYVKAGHIQVGGPPPDWASFRWAARTAYDIGTGMVANDSARKHLTELNEALGLTPPFLSAPSKGPVQQPILPPFDINDPSGTGGDVHTMKPPELVIPSGSDRNFWRGDIGGVMLPTAPPWVDGANSTPPEMTMSFLLPKYVQFGTPVVDTFLTAHAQRGYTHFHLDRGTGISAVGMQGMLDLIAYIQSWGFFTSFWLCGTGDDRSGGWPMLQPMIEPFLQGLIAKGLADKSIALVGEELNSGCVPGNGANGLDGIINSICAITNPVGIPTWLHFTQNVPTWAAPGQDSVAWIQQFTGKLAGICSQLNPNDTAGAQGAHLWDTRWRWAQADPSFRVVAFEIMATAQLYGKCTEAYGNLRGLEMLYCTRGNPAPNAPAVAGFGNGGRYPDGTCI